MSVGASRISTVGNSFLNALTTGNAWTKDTITFGFFDAGDTHPASAGSGGSGNSIGWNPDEIKLVEEAFAEISTFADLSFESVTVDNADIKLAKDDILDWAGWSGSPFSNQPVITIFKSSSLPNNTFLVRHEIGHALGLSHPFENKVFPGVVNPSDPGSFGFNNHLYTSLTYIFSNISENSISTIPGIKFDIYPDKFGSLDIATYQALYGANENWATGNNSYNFENSLQTIWDAGGIDEIDFSSINTNSVIDLRAATLQMEKGGAGYFSYGFQGDGISKGAINISYGVVIENATGGNLDDRITGNGAENVLKGQQGNDILDGGPGIDTAVYSGSQASFTLTLSPTFTSITDRRADGNGTDQLIDMEFLDFDTEIPALGGQPLNLAMFGGPTELSEENFTNLIELYIAYFDRAPDALGLNFWATNYSKGQPLEEIATLFLDQDETRALYPDGTSDDVFLENVYTNVLGRLPDGDGFAFWLSNLDSGDLGRDEFIFNFLGGAQGSDVSFLENKVMIGTYFAVTKGMSDGVNGAAIMDLFDGTEASIKNAVAAIDGYYADALDPTSGEFLMPLVGVLDDPFAMA